VTPRNNFSNLGTHKGIYSQWNDTRIIANSEYSTVESVTVFKFIKSQWKLVKILVASDGNSGDGFGNNYLLIESTAFIGAENAGKVYVYTFDGYDWRENQIIKAPKQSKQFGKSLAFSNGVLTIEDANSQQNIAGYTFKFENDGQWHAFQEPQQFTLNSKHTDITHNMKKQENDSGKEYNVNEHLWVIIVGFIVGALIFGGAMITCCAAKKKPKEEPQKNIDGLNPEVPKRISVDNGTINKLRNF